MSIKLKTPITTFQSVSKFIYKLLQAFQIKMRLIIKLMHDYGYGGDDKREFMRTISYQWQHAWTFRHINTPFDNYSII